MLKWKCDTRFEDGIRWTLNDESGEPVRRVIRFMGEPAEAVLFGNEKERDEFSGGFASLASAGAWLHCAARARLVGIL